MISKRVWTLAEDEFVIANHRTMSCALMAIHLDRTEAATKGRIYKLNRRQQVQAIATPKKPAKPPAFTFDPTPCAERELGWKK